MYLWTFKTNSIHLKIKKPTENTFFKKKKSMSSTNIVSDNHKYLKKHQNMHKKSSSHRQKSRVSQVIIVGSVYVAGT